MNAKKNILIIVPHLSRGGAERSAAKLSELLDAEFNVYIVTFFDQKLFTQSYSYKGELHSLNQKVSNSAVHKIINAIQRITFLWKFKKKYQIDTSISYLFNADTANILSKRQDKTIASIRTHLSTNKHALARKKQMKKLYPKADKIITQNKRGQEDLIENFNVPSKKTMVVPNFYDIAEIDQDTQVPVSEWNNTEQYIKLIQVGRMNYPKGQWHLLRILKHTLTDVPNARLIIIGSGELRSYLKDYAAQLGLRVQDLTDTDDKTPDFEQYHVILNGFSANPFKYLYAADIFLFTSLYEGFPNALAEAMICACTVMSTDCETGPRELIAPNIHHIENYPLHTDYGILFPNFNGKKIPPELPILPEEQLWVDTIKTYAKDTTIFEGMGKNAKERMGEYDKNEVRQMWINILEE